jgi:hypothetical protein
LLEYLLLLCIFYVEDKENSINVNDPSQEEEVHQTYTTSKNTLHILRLAAILHILQHYAISVLRGITSDIPLEIPVKRLQQSKIL